MTYDKPKVTVDLAEYNHLKSIEADSKSIVKGITENELSDVVHMLIVGLRGGSGRIDSVCGEILRNTNILVRIDNSTITTIGAPLITFTKKTQ